MVGRIQAASQQLLSSAVTFIECSLTQLFLSPGKGETPTKKSAWNRAARGSNMPPPHCSLLSHATPSRSFNLSQGAGMGIKQCWDQMAPTYASHSPETAYINTALGLLIPQVYGVFFLFLKP